MHVPPFCFAALIDGTSKFILAGVFKSFHELKDDNKVTSVFVGSLV